jgi:hypothetical protein
MAEGKYIRISSRATVKDSMPANGLQRGIQKEINLLKLMKDRVIHSEDDYEEQKKEIAIYDDCIVKLVKKYFEYGFSNESFN